MALARNEKKISGSGNLGLLEWNSLLLFRLESWMWTGVATFQIHFSTGYVKYVNTTILTSQKQKCCFQRYVLSMSCLSSGCLWYPRPLLHHPWRNKGGMRSHICGEYNSHLLVNIRIICYIHYHIHIMYNLIAIPATMFPWWSALPAEWGLRWLEPLLQVVFLLLLSFIFFCCRWFDLMFECSFVWWILLKIEHSLLITFFW